MFYLSCVLAVFAMVVICYAMWLKKWNRKLLNDLYGLSDTTIEQYRNIEKLRVEVLDWQHKAHKANASLSITMEISNRLSARNIELIRGNETLQIKNGELRGFADALKLKNQKLIDAYITCLLEKVSLKDQLLHGTEVLNVQS